METFKKKLGADHPDTLTSMANLAFTWEEQSWDGEAVDLIRECVRLHQRILGLNHPNYISSLELLEEWETEQTDTGALARDMAEGLGDLALHKEV